MSFHVGVNDMKMGYQLLYFRPKIKKSTGSKLKIILAILKQWHHEKKLILYCQGSVVKNCLDIQKIPNNVRKYPIKGPKMETNIKIR